MRTFFPSASKLPERPLRRALVLSGLLVIVWAAIVLLPQRAPEPAPTTRSEPNAASAPVPPGDLATTEPAESGPIAGQAAATLAPAERLVPAETKHSLIGPGYLVVLVLLAAGGAFALWLRRGRDPVAPSQRLKEIGRLRAGPQQHLHLVACADEILLIGATPGQVSLLKAYPAALFRTASPVAAEMMRPPATAARPESEPAPAVPTDEATGEEQPEWTVASASALDEGPDFMTVMRRYAGSRSYRANTLYPSRSGSTPS